jgi:hypothetical protein
MTFNYYLLHFAVFISIIIHPKLYSGLILKNVFALDDEIHDFNF